METMLNYELDKTYSKSCLVSLFSTYWSGWLRSGWISSRIPADAKTLLPGKEAYQKILHQFYTDKELFDTVYLRFTPAVQQAFNDVAWYGSVDIVKLEKAYDLEIAAKDAARYYHTPSEMHSVLSPEFRFFRYEGSYYTHSYSYQKREFSGRLVLPTELCMWLRKMLPKPTNYDLNIVADQEVQTTYRQEEENNETVSQIELCYTYVTEGNIEVTAKGNRMTVKSLRLMKNYCRIKEFFSEPDSNLIKTELMVNFLRDSIQHTKQQDRYVFESPPKLLKQLFENFFEDTKQYDLPSMVLPHLKGYFDDRSVGVSFRAVLRALPRTNNWVTSVNCLDYIIFRNIDFDLIERQILHHDIYITERGEWSTERIYITSQNYYQYLSLPLIQGLFFLAAAFGIVDIAYDAPQEKEQRVISKTPYLTPWSGLRFVRLTPLGRFVLGIDRQFEGSLTDNSGELILDDYNLIATVTGESKIIRLALGKIGTPLDEHRYEVTPASLFKECQSAADIERKIRLFKKNIAKPLPAHWERFFADALQNINPLHEETNYVALRLRQDNQLIATVGTHSLLKKYILKAEGYHILVKRSDLTIVRQLLSQTGYFSEL